MPVFQTSAASFAKDTTDMRSLFQAFAKKTPAETQADVHPDACPSTRAAQAFVATRGIDVLREFAKSDSGSALEGRIPELKTSTKD